MSQLTEAIKSLKAEKDAVIMAHYYANSDIKQVADLIGDSYFLAEAATKTHHNTIVLCGVSFMGESVKLLNPQKTVLIPDMAARCPMAEMYTIEKINNIKQEYKDVAVVCYINSTAELKNHCDVCVTSANAVKVVRALPNNNIYFLPDINLGRYVASQIPEKNIILHDGFCYVHAQLKAEDVMKVKAQYPDAKILVHPECEEDVVSLADFVGSTSGIYKYASSSEAENIIVCTETGILYELQKDNPEKNFYFPCTPICRDMKKMSLEKIKHVLESGENEVIIDDAGAETAKTALKRMLELSGK